MRFANLMLFLYERDISASSLVQRCSQTRPPLLLTVDIDNRYRMARWQNLLNFCKEHSTF